MKNLFFLGFFLLFGCAQPTESTTSLIHVQGIVWNESTEQPIENILVQLNKYDQRGFSWVLDSVRTNVTGDFHFAYVPLDTTRFILQIFANYPSPPPNNPEVSIAWFTD